jgi:hypothetical protein
MASRVIERPPTTPPDSWVTAPVTVGRHRRWLGWAPFVLVVVAVGALALLLGRQAPTTSLPAQPQPEPPEPHTTVSVPFDVAVEVADVATMDNDELFGKDTAIPDRAVHIATREVDEVLTRYLDAEFVTAQTRFSDGPLADLLSQRASDALSEDDRAGLGALELSAQEVQAEPVAATARVLTSGSDVVIVAVRYDARALVTTHDGDRVPLRQRATMVFVPEDGGWRAEAINAVLDLPLPGEEVAR